MLPGYNHNIRYKDKVFHVQTEDNGLDDPALVTQVFLGGQIVAIERSSYGDVLVDELEEKARDDKIKNLMQEQHKRLLKNLVRGDYDPKIEMFVKGAAGRDAAPSSAPAAPTLPQPPSHEIGFDALDAAIQAAEQEPITAESLLAPDAVLGLNTNELFPVDPNAITQRPAISTPSPQKFRVGELKAVLDASKHVDSDEVMLGMIEQHVHQEMPWSPNASKSSESKSTDPSSAATLEDPSAGANISHIQKARELARQMNASAKPAQDQFAQRVDTKRIPIEDDKNTMGVDEAPTKIARRKPSNPNTHAASAASPKASEGMSRGFPMNEQRTEQNAKAPDTLVDFGLPASLKREIDEELARRQAAPTQPPPHVPGPSKSDPASRPPVYRAPPPKPEGRYSSVRKAPADRPFDAATTPVDPNLDKMPRRRDRFPSVGRPESQPDTLIDVAAPAAGQTPMARKNSRPAPLPGQPDPKTGSGGPRKITEVNKSQAPTAPVPPASQSGSDETKRPSILVVERSLDEVILSYLYDEMAEK